MTAPTIAEDPNEVRVRLKIYRRAAEGAETKMNSKRKKQGRIAFWQTPGHIYIGPLSKAEKAERIFLKIGFFSALSAALRLDLIVA